MKHPNQEIDEEMKQMSGSDSRGLVVLLPLIQFIDRNLEAERRWVEAEFRHYDAALRSQAQTDDLRHLAGDAKIQKANEVLDYRLEEMNNFRAQINVERAEYLRREMYDREHTTLAERVKSLEILRGEQSGKTAAYASMVAVVVVGVQVVLHFWK